MTEGLFFSSICLFTIPPPRSSAPPFTQGRLTRQVRTWHGPSICEANMAARSLQTKRERTWQKYFCACFLFRVVVAPTPYRVCGNFGVCAFEHSDSNVNVFRTVETPVPTDLQKHSRLALCTNKMASCPVYCRDRRPRLSA